MEASGGLDYFGVDEHGDVLTFAQRAIRAAAPLGLGTIAAVVLRNSHPVLAFLGVSALTGNVQAVARGERTIKEAALRMGRHAVATAGALAMPSHAWLGYIGGAFAGDLLFDGHGTGIVDEWAHFADVDINNKVKPDNDTKSLAVREKK